MVEIRLSLRCDSWTCPRDLAAHRQPGHLLLRRLPGFRASLGPGRPARSSRRNGHRPVPTGIACFSRRARADRWRAADAQRALSLVCPVLPHAPRQHGRAPNPVRRRRDGGVSSPRAGARRGLRQAASCHHGRVRRRRAHFRFERHRRGLAGAFPRQGHWLATDRPSLASSFLRSIDAKADLPRDGSVA